jgi:hypothetical protein
METPELYDSTWFANRNVPTFQYVKDTKRNRVGRLTHPLLIETVHLLPACGQIAGPLIGFRFT